MIIQWFAQVVIGTGTHGLLDHVVAVMARHDDRFKRGIYARHTVNKFKPRYSMHPNVSE